MSDDISRRDLLKAAGAAAAVPIVGFPGRGAADRAAGLGPSAARRGGSPILPLTSTSEVFVPPRGNAFQKFSFDFPEPSVEYQGLRFAFLVFSRENAYGLSAERMTAEADGDALVVTCTDLVWAGGQERAPGRLVARLRRNGSFVEWDVTAEMEQPIKAVTTVLRGVPRGKVSVGGGGPVDVHDDEVLIGYPFGGGDLFGGNTAWGAGTPLAIVQAGDADFFFLSSLDDRVRTKRLYFQPGEAGYRVECVFEVEGWLDQRRVEVPRLAGGARRHARSGRAAALRPPREGLPHSPLRRPRRRARVAPRHRAGGGAARDALHRLRVQRLRADARDPPVDRDAHSAPRACWCSCRRGTAGTTGTTRSTSRRSGSAASAGSCA